jgi:hypothetical protein
MSVLGAIAGHRSIAMWSSFGPDECIRRLEDLPDISTSEISANRLTLQRNRSSPYFRLRSGPPPVVYATLVPVRGGAEVAVDGRMSYGQLATVGLFALFFCGMPVVLLAHNSRPRGGVVPVFLFAAAWSAAIYLASLLGAIYRTRDLAQRVAVALSDRVSAGWFADPSGRHRLRYWDGQQWSRWVVDGDKPAFEESTTDLQIGGSGIGPA